MPGISSALAAPAYAGIPVTARGWTQDVCVVTGHLDPEDPASRVRWQALATGPGTLVVLMGHDRLPLLTRSLIRFGRDARTPAACIQDGTHPTQRVVVSTLEHLADDVAAAGLRAPVATVIGDVVRLRDALRWFDREEQTHDQDRRTRSSRSRTRSCAAGSTCRRLPPLSRAVVERVVHASADLSYVDDLVLDEAALRRGADALAAGAPVVADVQMVAAGITSRPRRLPRPRGAGRTTASRAAPPRCGMAFDEVGPGAVWVVGCAPTALFELLELGVDPALVVGLPVGFVGAAESKAALRDSGLPAVSNVSEKGGSAVAAAALNALLYPARGDAVSPRRTVPPCSSSATAPRATPGCAQFAELVERVQLRAPYADVAGGFLELAPPPIQDAVRGLVEAGHRTVDVVPLVLVAAGHSKGDIPAALERERAAPPRAVGSGTADRSAATPTCSPSPSGGSRSWSPRESVGRHRGRARRPRRHRPRRQRRGGQDRPAAAGGPRDRHGRDGVHQPRPAVRARRPRPGRRASGTSGSSCCRGSCSPACCPTASSRRPPSGPAQHPEVDVRTAGLLGPGDELAGVVLERWAEIGGGDLRMNCDTCAYRVALPGFEDKVGAPQTPHDHPDDPAAPARARARPRARTRARRTRTSRAPTAVTTCARLTSAHDLRHHGDAEATPGLLDLAVNVRGDGAARLARRAGSCAGSTRSAPTPTSARPSPRSAAAHDRPAETRCC